MSHLAQTEMSTIRGRATHLTPQQIWQLGILATLTIWAYASTLYHLIGQWYRDSNFSYGFFIPLFSGYVIWEERQRLARLIPQPVWSGLAVLVAGLGLLILGQMGAELFVSRSSLLVVLVGIIVLFYGWNFLRALLFPVAFLQLMIPIPVIIFNQIAFPLQLLASKVSADVLPVFGVPVLREGNVMNLPSMSLQVAEACSGLRSLMALIALSIIYGYLLERRIWARCVLAIASVPIAVAANCVRIVGTGLLVQYWNPDKAEGYFHASWGWIIFVVALGMLAGVHWLLGLSADRRRTS